MSKLTEFLVKNNITNVEKEIELTGRLEGMKFRIRSLTSKEFEEYRNKCFKMNAKGEVSINNNDLATQVIKNCVIEPCFKDAKMLSEANCNTPEEFINSRLQMGEISALFEAISDLSGNNISLKEKVEEAKN